MVEIGYAADPAHLVAVTHERRWRPCWSRQRTEVETVRVVISPDNTAPTA